MTWPRRDRRWILVIGGTLLAILAVRLVVERPSQLGLGLPAIVPIILAAYCFSFRGALAAAAAATLVFLLSAGEIPDDDLAVATAMRALAFFGTGLVVAELLRRAGEQATVIADQRSELEELRVLREALTPAAVPETPGLDVATVFVAAEAQVAGDFYLVMPGEQGTLLAVGDAVGHGVRAARRASYVRAMLATMAGSSQDPARLLELANTALVESDPGRLEFITVICALVSEDRVTWASAGHPPPWDLDSGEPLEGVPPFEPLGVVAGLAYASATAPLAHGGGVLLFSDGLTEARRPGVRARLYGEGRARELLRRHRGRPPGEVVRALEESARGFAGGMLADDLCLLAARRA